MVLPLFTHVALQVHGVDFYSGADGELSVEVYKSVKERLKRTAPDVEFRCMRTSKPKSGALVDEKKRAVPPHIHCSLSVPVTYCTAEIDCCSLEPV